LVIKRSSAAETQRLVADLLGEDAVRREAAAARLAIIGPRTLDRLQERLVAGTSPADLATVLGVLERIGDERAAQMATPWLADEAPEVASAAVAVVRTQLLARKAAASTAALESLTSLVLDPARHEAVRVAALEALHDLPLPVVEPLLERLASDANHMVRQRAGHGPAVPAAGTEAQVPASAGAARAGATPRKTGARATSASASAAASPPLAPAGAVGAAGAAAIGTSAPWSLHDTDAGLPSDPDLVREALAREGADAPLSLLHRLVVGLAARERTEADARARGAWRAVRGVAHQALGERGSRVALYDLRESLERDSDALPLGMLAALERIGDQSCLEPMASAFTRTADEWQRERLREAAAAIIRRERLTRRSAIVKRMETKAGGILGN
jgi:hypothetical protein